MAPSCAYIYEHQGHRAALHVIALKITYCSHLISFEKKTTQNGQPLFPTSS